VKEIDESGIVFHNFSRDFETVTFSENVHQPHHFEN
jgi:hypothetical protein